MKIFVFCPVREKLGIGGGGGGSDKDEAVAASSVVLLQVLAILSVRRRFIFLCAVLAALVRGKE